MKKSTKTIIRTILFLCLGGLFGYSISSVAKSSHRSDSITQILKENCDCKEVNQVIYAKGIQFGPNGLSTEKVEYQLVDCKFKSVKIETERIQELLQSQVEGFENVDLLELEFVNGNSNEVVVIKKGIIQ